MLQPCRCWWPGTARHGAWPLSLTCCTLPPSPAAIAALESKALIDGTTFSGDLSEQQMVRLCGLGAQRCKASAALLCGCSRMWASWLTLALPCTHCMLLFTYTFLRRWTASTPPSATAAPAATAAIPAMCCPTCKASARPPRPTTGALVHAAVLPCRACCAVASAAQKAAGPPTVPQSAERTALACPLPPIPQVHRHRRHLQGAQDRPRCCAGLARRGGLHDDRRQQGSHSVRCLVSAWRVR